MIQDNNKLRGIVVAVLALFAALYLGIAAATAQFEAIAWIVGGMTIAVCLLLGRNIWMLVPLFGALSLTIKIPGQPDTLLIAQFLFISFSVLLILMRRLPMHFHFGKLEFAILLVVLMVIQVYVRNPAGVLLLGGNTVGGKAYFIFAISTLTGVMLASLQVTPKDLSKLLPLTLIGWALNAVVIVIGMFIPAFGVWFGGRMDSGQNVETTMIDDQKAVQMSVLNPIGARIMVFISAFISPLKACFSPRWLPLVLLAMFITGMSGFRSAAGLFGLSALVGIAYRGGLLSLFASGLIGCMALAAVALTNSITPLPPNIQRTFSFLPGTWGDQYIQTTQESTDWRVEIWKEVLFTDRWIANKWLGDGLGFTRQELMAQINVVEMRGKVGVSGFDLHREAILANGDYHSGPVQTIRSIGYVGLLFLLIAQISLAVEAHRQIKRTRGTVWYPTALVVGIPIVVYPLYFVFIFGTFKESASILMMGYGILSLFKHNLPLPHLPVVNRRTPVKPLETRNNKQPA